MRMSRGRHDGARVMNGRYFRASTENDPSVTLSPLLPEDCPSLAAAIVVMEPWSVMQYPADRLCEYLATQDEGVTRCIIEIAGEKAGIISVRYPWLKGPYLELLALLSPFQLTPISSFFAPGRARCRTYSRSFSKTSRGGVK